MTLLGKANSATISGLKAKITLVRNEPSDVIRIRGFGGNDRINATRMAAAASELTLTGGTGTDTATNGELITNIP